MVVYNWKTLDSLQPSKRVYFYSVGFGFNESGFTTFQVTTNPDPDSVPDSDQDPGF